MKQHRHPERPSSHSLRAPVALALLLVLAGTSSAQAVHDVPGDFPSIQEAIDAAAPGDIVLVAGGTHEGPITIDRPLTLMGDPQPSIRPRFQVFDFMQPPAIVLAGSGSGKVVLVNLSVGGQVNGITTASSSAGIQGGGFAELHLLECRVAGPFWTLLTGQAFGSPALRTSVPRILLQHSSLRGADSANDGCYGNGPPGPAGIEAPTSSVVVLDSLVRGGGSDSICGFGSCPIGGDGGTGIVARELWEAASDIQGGSGALYSIQGDPAPCGAAPDGAARQVVRHALLGGELTAANRLRLGKSSRLSWSTSGSTSLLLIGSKLRLSPLRLPSGPLFVDLHSVSIARCYPAGSGNFDLRLPLDTSLLGREVVAQVRGGSAGWTRPLIEVVRSQRDQRQEGQ